MKLIIKIGLLTLCFSCFNTLVAIPNLDSLKYQLQQIKQEETVQNNSIQRLFQILGNLEARNDLETKPLIFQTLHELSDQFYQLGLYDYALNYNQKAMQYANEFNNRTDLYQLQLDKGNIYNQIFDFKVEKKQCLDSAYVSFQTALELVTPEKDIHDLSSLYNGLAQHYIQSKKYQEAKTWSRMAEKQASLWNNKEMSILSSYYLSKIYLEQGDFDHAIKESKYQLNQRDISKFLKLKMLFYNNLYIANNELGEPKKALVNLENYLNLQEQLNQNLNPSNSIDINQLYQAEQLRNENLSYQVEASINQTNETKSQIAIILLVAALFVIIVVGVTYLLNERYKQQNLRLKLIQKVQQFEIESINSLVDGREMERKDIGRFLHDDVSALVNSANIHLEVLASQGELTDNPILLKAQQILDEIADKVRSLSHKLLNDVLQKYGLEVALKEMTARIDTSLIQFKFESDLKTEQRYNTIVETKVYGIVQELVSNILKHSQATKAKVFLKQTEKFLVVQVNDNGKGFSKEDIKNGGVGLNQIRSRVRSMNGELKMDSSDGARIQLKIPLNVALNEPAKPSLVT